MPVRARQEDPAVYNYRAETLRRFGICPLRHLLVTAQLLLTQELGPKWIPPTADISTTLKLEELQTALPSYLLIGFVSGVRMGTWEHSYTLDAYPRTKLRGRKPS